MLERIRIVLVETSLPGNIGAAARAMKTMGLSQLVLVRPRGFPSAEASARASGADDVLAAARVVDTLTEALSGCRWVAGSSARLRKVKWPLLTPRECAAQALGMTAAAQAALVFGRERSGLTNAELDHCSALVHIDANPAYSALNLAAAVQVLCYELRVAAQQGVVADSAAAAGERSLPASQDRIEGFYAHFERTLVEIGFMNPDNPRLLMRRLRRLFSRARLEDDEVNILRGICSALQKRAKALETER